MYISEYIYINLYRQNKPNDCGLDSNIIYIYITVSISWLRHHI